MPFTFEAFQAWYDTLTRHELEPARLTFQRILSQVTAPIEAEFGTGRFRKSQSRIKDPIRLWVKMHGPKYHDRIKILEHIPQVIDDLVGVRVICTNKSDLRRLQASLEKIKTVAVGPGPQEFGIAVEAGSTRDYIRDPKPSGYRAFHLNLIAAVPGLTGTSRVRGELQVRTLLQDGWGELTHEDTYKPGQETPELVTVLSLRMGELLATVDDIAEDIQADLAREAKRSDLGVDPEVDPVTPKAPNSPTVSDQIVLAETRRIVSDLSGPTSLATVAARLRATFGPDAVKGWLGRATFKALLVEAVPDVHIEPVGPSYVIPPDATPDDSWPVSLRDRLEDESGRLSAGPAVEKVADAATE